MKPKGGKVPPQGILLGIFEFITNIDTAFTQLPDRLLLGAVGTAGREQNAHTESPTHSVFATSQ